MNLKKIIAMIPARMGSKRLTTKNLRELDGQPLITRAIQKARDAAVFDEIWVNSEHPAFGEIAMAHGVGFHRRPDSLANDTATSEEFVAEFFEAHPCDLLVQVHSIAPLIGAKRVGEFAKAFLDADVDVMLSVLPESLECLYEGRPVNFSMTAKQNSQDLRPIERVTWGLTGWRRDTYLASYRKGLCATWHGKVKTFALNRFEGHVIKTEEDLRLAECMISLMPTERTD